MVWLLITVAGYESPSLVYFPLINVVISSYNYRCTCSFHFLFLPSGSAFQFPPCLLSARACMHANMQGQRSPLHHTHKKNTLTNYHHQQSLANLFINGWEVPAPSIFWHTIAIVSHPATPPHTQLSWASINFVRRHPRRRVDATLPSVPPWGPSVHMMLIFRTMPSSYFVGHTS